MRVSRILLALLLVAGLAGAVAWAYEVARPHVHPIKVADARKYGPGPTGPVVVASADPAQVSDERGELFGRARAVDGDTLMIDGVQADLWTIVAPKLDETCSGADTRPWACGQASRDHLQHLVEGRRVACIPEGPPPSDGSWLGLCFVAEAPCRDASAPCKSDLNSLNLAQVRKGWARDFEGQYSEPEADAQEDKAGIWAGGVAAESDR